jgi:ATP-dependent DNA ligase
MEPSEGTTPSINASNRRRVQLHIANDDIKVFTRRGNDWTKRFKKIASAAYLVNAGSVIIDGEVVVPAADGTTDFSVLQNQLFRKVSMREAPVPFMRDPSR